MSNPFIRNHQYNLIKQQAKQLLIALNTVSDLKVVESIRHGIIAKLMEVFPDATQDQMQMLEQLTTFLTAEDIQQYLRTLERYLIEFPHLTDKQLKKLFPKQKKLRVPDLSAIDHRFLTYLGWTDIATNQMFLVYPLDGQLVGIEGRFTPVHKKTICLLCKKHEDVALFSAVTKSKPANASADYYKAVGNYMCTNSNVCNRHITDVTALETFLSEIVGRRHSS